MLRTLKSLLCLVALSAVVLPASAETGLRSHYPQADRILVKKSERKLYLLQQARVLKAFDIALGLMPKGAKEREGDFRTPEGLYHVETKKPDSDYFLAIKVSYPSAKDLAHARELGVDPGGQIMIHGQPNNPKYDERRYQGWDWTDGCIAVSNSDMVDIWLMTSESTPIEIRP